MKNPERSSLEKPGNPDIWVKCDCRRRVLYQGELSKNAMVCPHCDRHHYMPAMARIALLSDPGSFVEINGDLESRDPLNFVNFTINRPYPEQLVDAKSKTSLNEAIITGYARMNGIEVVMGAMEPKFVGGSMGSVVGEKVSRAFEEAKNCGLPVVMTIASGGARMQEGVFSLMQMAKTVAAVRRHHDAGLGYISNLTDPTYGGVTASFATSADIIVAEPGARIGFAGRRVIEETIRTKTPKNFQTAEFFLEHGMLDSIVPRNESKKCFIKYLGYMGYKKAS